MSIHDSETVAKSEDCMIISTSSSFESLVGYQYEVYDLSWGRELLSQWRDGEALLERLEDVNHPLTEEFREHWESQEEDHA